MTSKINQSINEDKFAQQAYKMWMD